MFHSTVSKSVVDPANHYRSSNQNYIHEHSVLVCNDMCPTVLESLASRFQVTRYRHGLKVDQFDAQISDCRGRSITSDFPGGPTKCALTFALVDKSSYLACNPCEEDMQLELITEAELKSEIIHLRIASRLRFNESKKNEQFNYQNNSHRCDKHRTVQHTSNSQQQDNTQDIIKENAYEILQALMQHSTDWIVIKDLEHRFALVTDRFLQSHKKMHHEVIGRNDLEIGTPKERVLGDKNKNLNGFWVGDDRVVQSGEPELSEHAIIAENALNQIHENVARVPIKNKRGEVVALLVCVTQALSSKINDDTVTTRVSRNDSYRPFNPKNVGAKKSNSILVDQPAKVETRRNNNFIATASHDLRQPLHAIGLFIDALEKNTIDSTQRSLLSKMKLSHRNLSDLLTSVLYISKLDAQAVVVDKSNFTIMPLVQSIVDEFETEATNKSIQIQVDACHATVCTDKLLLGRILKNLVSNAVKYTTQGSIGLYTEIDRDHLVIRVADTGPGIPKEQYQTVFMEHLPIHDQQDQPNFGYGLGLSIVKRLTDLLELDISLQSEPECGTEFNIRMPLANISDSISEKDTVTNSASESPPYKLMVIDDNSIVLEAMEQMFTSIDCDAYPAQDISEALEIVNELEELPDVLVVDYQLANGITGDMAIDKIRAAAKTDIPAIIVTGNTNSELVRKATESGFRVLNKPVNSAALLNTISSAMNDNQRT